MSSITPFPIDYMTISYARPWPVVSSTENVGNNELCNILYWRLHTAGLITMLGELIYDATGKIQGTRVLPDGRVEQSFQHSGKFWGVEGMESATATSTWRPDGTFSFEVNGFFASKTGDVVTFKGSGIGWPSGPGWKSSIRGSVQYWTPSEKLAVANKVIGVFEVESDENGNDHVKAWAWK